MINDELRHTYKFNSGRKVVTIKNIPYASADYKLVWQLREDVLRTPLGLTLKNEDLSAEEYEFIFAIFVENDIAGCMILKKVSDTVLKLRQMAVANQYQGKGMGRELLLFADQYAVQNGYQTIELHARDVAISFYEKSGYHIVGPGFIEVEIPHHKMVKLLF